MISLCGGVVNLGCSSEIAMWDLHPAEEWPFAMWELWYYA